MARPSVIDAILRHDETGTPVSVFDSIVIDLRAGHYVETACAHAGIHKDTYYGWLKTAAQLRLANAGHDPKRATAHERRCLAFSDAVAIASSSWEDEAVDLANRLMRGGITTTKTMIKRGPPAPGSNDTGAVLETVTTTERLAPNVQVLLWRLERRFPARYGRRVEISGVDGGPISLSMEERADALAANLDAYLRGHQDAKARRKGRADEPDAAGST